GTCEYRMARPARAGPPARDPAGGRGTRSLALGRGRGGGLGPAARARRATVAVLTGDVLSARCWRLRHVRWLAPRCGCGRAYRRRWVVAARRKANVVGDGRRHLPDPRGTIRRAPLRPRHRAAGERRLSLATRDAQRLGHEGDAVAVALLERLSQHLITSSQPPPQTAGDLYALWVDSPLVAEDYPAMLELWGAGPEGPLLAELQLA